MQQSSNTQYPENSLLAFEIARQPELWLDTLDRVRLFLQERPLPDGPVVITGAGTSAYAGQAIAVAWTGACCIPTTDLILLSEEEIRMAVPGLEKGGLILSLARSGDSPESAGVVQRMQKLFPRAQHVAISCNGEGRLAKMPEVRALVLSPETNDRSLAMTSSFSNLCLAGLLLVHHEELAKQLPAICRKAKESLEMLYGTAVAVAAVDSPLCILLTSSMHSLATEGALKLLELTAGDRLGIAEGFLAFRHGPTGALRANTPVLCFTSSDPLKLRYERDFVQDLRARGLGRIALVGDERVADWPHDWLVPSLAPTLPDYLRTPFEIVFTQLFAYASSLRAHVDPDNPSPNGEITRVVKPFQLQM